MGITVDEEVEFYITYSAIIPRLLIARRKLVSVSFEAKHGRRSDYLTINLEVDACWELLF